MHMCEVYSPNVGNRRGKMETVCRNSCPTFPRLRRSGQGVRRRGRGPGVFTALAFAYASGSDQWFGDSRRFRNFLLRRVGARREARMRLREVHSPNIGAQGRQNGNGWPEFLS